MHKESLQIQTLSEHRLGDILVRYVTRDDRPALPGLMILPADLADDTLLPRPWITAHAVTNLPARWGKLPAFDIEPLVQFKLNGLPLAAGAVNGRSKRGAPEVYELELTDQKIETSDGETCILTRLHHPASGLDFTHSLLHSHGKRVLRISTRATNSGTDAVRLDFLSSFTLGCLSPFTPWNHPEQIFLHRFASTWSAEARPLCQSLEELHLEPSWAGYAPRILRFGVNGSMPTNDWFPVVGVEDRNAGVFWAAQLDVPGSWQIEVCREKDYLSLDGGLPDADLGAWYKNLAPGESFTAPEAWLTCDKASAEDTWPRLFDAYPDRPLPAPEKELPVAFNEWCHSWGNPSHDTLVALADRLQNSGIGYFVIDDGWAERPGEALLQSNGDWLLNDQTFPHGLRKTVEQLEVRGLHAGLWFEFEVCNQGSKAWEQTTHHLHRDGRVLQVGSRRFWNFQDPWVVDYLSEKVIARLRESGIKYLKVDYNDTIGLGCDGAESPGEGLRLHLAGVLRFFEKIRSEVPDIVIENCSSGGFREVAPFIARTDMCSFSDAHETESIPIIAANLLPLIPSHKIQIWAVLREDDSPERLHYSLAATFLGRAALSGTVENLAPWQWEIVRAANRLHRDYGHLLLNSRIRRLSAFGPSYNHPTGWQGVWRHGDQHSTLVLHSFADSPEQIGPIDHPGLELETIFAVNPASLLSSGESLSWHNPGDFNAAFLVFRKTPGSPS